MELFNLSKSKTREKIFKLFFSNPEKKFYLRELERILNISVGNIRRELLMLEKIGVFKHEKIGKMTFYYLNKEAPIFEELKSIVFKTIGIEGALKNGLKKIKGIKHAFIFGSFAKNKEQSNSDIDLMIIGKVNENELIKIISKLEKNLRREINYHLIDEKEWLKRLKTDSFVKAVNVGPKIKII